jgi:hypothetical protein
MDRNKAGAAQQNAGSNWKDHPEFFGVWAALGAVALLYIAALFGWLAPWAFQLPGIGSIASHTVRCRPVAAQVDLMMVVQGAIVCGWFAVTYFFWYLNRYPSQKILLKNNISKNIKLKQPNKDKPQLWNQHLIVIVLLPLVYAIGLINPNCESAGLTRLPVWLVSITTTFIPSCFFGLFFSLNVIDQSFDSKQFNKD